MAIDKILQIYDEQGNLVDYDILASDVKFLPDGKDLPTKLAEMDDAIDEAAEGGGYTPPEDGIPKNDLAQSVQDSLELADLSLQPSDKSQLQTALNSKANDNAVVKSISVNGGTPVTPTNGNVDISVEGEAGEDGITPHIGQNGNWWIGPETNPANDTGVRAQGPKGNSVADGDTFDIVNNLTEGGESDALSAEMGKQLAGQVSSLEDAVEDIEGGSYDISVVGDAIVINSLNNPRVNVGSVGNNSLSAKVGNTTTTSFYVSGRKLTSAIQISVSDLTNWSVSPTSISPSNGKVELTPVTITYQPASGSTAGASQPCTVTISSTGATSSTIAMTGTVVAAPTITLTLSSDTITTASGVDGTTTLNVKGAALEGDISLSISGTGFSLSPNSVAQADAESSAGADITVTFDGNTAGSATITASSTGATDVTATVEGVIPTPLAEGSYFIVPANNGNGTLKYTVLSDGNVSVQKNGTNHGLSSTAENPLVIPATINDADATAVYNSGGTAIQASGATYNVTTIPYSGFQNITALQAITLPEGLTTIDNRAFGATGLTKIVLPSSLTSMGSGDTYGNFGYCPLTEVEFKGDVAISGYAFNVCTSIMKVILNGNPVSNNAFKGCTQFTATEGTKPVVVQRATTPYVYRANSGITPFPENANSKVWATLYVDTPANWTTTGSSGMKWGVFDEVLDISNYSE